MSMGIEQLVLVKEYAKTIDRIECISTLRKSLGFAEDEARGDIADIISALENMTDEEYRTIGELDDIVFPVNYDDEDVSET